MGIGFDIFKAQIGARLADAVMDSFAGDGSDASYESEHIKSSDDTQDEKCIVNRSDMLRTLVFLMGNNHSLERSDKKVIAKYLSGMYTEEISLFSIEDKIDEAYEETKGKSAKEFFTEMDDILYDRDQAALTYACVLFLYSHLESSDSFSPAYEYNLSLIKRALEIKRNELAVCYKFFGEAEEMDTDDVADKFEELTSDEAMKKLEEEHPEFIRVEVKKELPPPPEPEPLPAPTVCENPREEITKLYYESMAAAGNNNVDFSKHVFLADDKPDFVIKAVKAYGKGCVGEDIILVFDNTFTKNCKDGLLLTTKNIYIGSGGILVAKIPLADVNFIDIKIGTFTNVVKINNTSMDSTQILNDGTKAFANFLQKIIPLAMQIEGESEKKGE